MEWTIDCPDACIGSWIGGLNGSTRSANVDGWTDGSSSAHVGVHPVQSTTPPSNQSKSNRGLTTTTTLPPILSKPPQTTTNGASANSKFDRSKCFLGSRPRVPCHAPSPGGQSH